MIEDAAPTIVTTVRLTHEARAMLAWLTLRCGECARTHMLERLIREEARRRGYAHAPSGTRQQQRNNPDA